jgi:ElaB/YqjD/DUF883 family membrane-anchored ribosome-binding protein
MASTTTEAREQGKEVASTAVDQARDVGRSARSATQSVAQDVRDEVGQVAGELRQQARTMVDETRTQLRDKADAQTTGVAERVGRLAEELRALANGHPEQAETARRYIDQAGSAIADVAGQLRDKDFETVVGDVQRFARRRPGAFLAATAAAGFVAGRLVRSMRDDAQSSPSPNGNGAGTAGTTSAPTAVPTPEAITSSDLPGQPVPPSAGITGTEIPATELPAGGAV